jgi:hypothetical protein
MIPKTLTGYNVPWLLEENLCVKSLPTPALPAAPSRHFDMALVMVVSSAFFLHHSSPGYQHIFPRRPLNETDSSEHPIGPAVQVALNLASSMNGHRPRAKQFALCQAE